MMNKYFNNKGMTIIELMIAILIAGMISAAISSYLIVHIRSYELAQDIVDIQYEAQLGLNGMSEIIMESRGLAFLEDQAGRMYSDLDPDPEVDAISDLTLGVNSNNDGYVEDVRIIAFEGLEDADDNTVYHVFVKEVDSTEILYYNTTNSAILTDIGEATMFARNVIGMSVVAGQGQHSTIIDETITTFEESDAIEVILTMERGEKTTMEIRTMAKYRNIRPD